MKQPNHRLRPAAGAVVCAVLFAVCPLAGRAADHPLLSSHVPPQIAAHHLQPAGSLPDTNRLRLAISLPLRDEAGLDKLLGQLYDPNSPNYHHYLSVAQFTDSFGPTKDDYQALRDFAKSNGLVEISTFPNRLVLGVEASVADIRRVFHVNIRAYDHPTEHRRFYAPDSEPALNLSVPVLHISGLDNYVVPHPFAHKKPMGGAATNSPSGGSQTFGAFWGYDFRRAYAPGVWLTGLGQNAGLVEFDGYYASDITTYEMETDLPNVPLINVPVDGGIFGAPGGGVGEVSLDIEMVIAMAPGLSSVYVYEEYNGGPGDDLLNRMASDDTCQQLSSSWGFNIDAGTDPILKEFATQGQSFYQASGDSDAYVGPIAAPEDDPYITLVGGTELLMNGMGASYNMESVWNTGYMPPGGAPQFSNYWGSGGGISTTVPIPIWQQGINMSNNLGSTSNRNTPDVALTADNIWVEAAQGTQSGVYMGTSCAAPLWCGFTALINQQASIYHMPPVGFINPAVYAIGKSNIYLSCFHDTTVGNNIWPGSGSNFPAVQGYDLCTGWGSPTGSNLINALVPPLSIPVLIVVTNYISGGNGTGIIGYDGCYNLTTIITNVGNVTATDVRGTLYSSTYGAIVGQATANFPPVPPRGSTVSSTPFTLSTEPSFVCGTPINLALVLSSDQASQTNPITLPSGVVGPPVVFSNTTPVMIPEGLPSGAFSPVVVSGLQSAAKVTVSVYAQTAYDGALTLQLISPSGSNVVLSIFNGGAGANYGSACLPGLETTFDDNATTPITAGTAPFVGSYQPQQFLGSLLPLSGANLNGVWQLNVIDSFNYPATLECWSLNITPNLCLDGGGQCPGSDLFLTMSASPNPVIVGSNEVYTLSVSNAGPSPASGVTISQTLPPGFNFITTSNYPVQTILDGNNLTLFLGTLTNYQSASVSVVAIPTIQEVATSVATLSTSGSNLNSFNATASVSTVVTLPSADLAVSMTASPASILQGGQTTFTILVTNNGPFTGTGVVLTNTLPASVNLVSSSTTQGNISADGVLTSLGTLAEGASAVVTFTVSPTLTGNITDSAQVGLGSLQMDPQSRNNSASFTVSVGPSADLAVSASVVPVTVVAGANCTYSATVVNNGPSAASDIVFSQTIPGGTGFNAATFVSSSITNVIVTNGFITWNVTNLASGASASITNILKTPTIQPGGRPISLSSTFSVYGQPGDANTNNNVLVVQSVVETPTISIVPAGAMLVSQSGSTLNGTVNPGETVGVRFFLENTGNIATSNLVATLQATGGVTLPGAPQFYGAVVPGASPVGANFTFTASGTNGGTVVATLSLQDGSNSLGTASYTFYLPLVQTFWNTNHIYIPAPSFVPYPDQGPANPYPSTVQVSNVVGFVSKVTVTLSNMYHTCPNDIGIILVGPQTNTVLMDAAAVDYFYMTNLTLTFDSSAAGVLPANGPLSAGSYQPADYNPNNIYTNAATNNIANLAVFSGLPANGTWMLYARDDEPGDAGGILNGWSLSITTVTPIDSTNSPASAYLQAATIAGGVQVSLLGQPGQLYQIESSSNLVNWTAVASNNASKSSGMLFYTDLQSNAPARFYRGVRLSQ